MIYITATVLGTRNYIFVEILWILAKIGVIDISRMLRNGTIAYFENSQSIED